LNDNIKENLSLDTVSRDIGVSKYYFHRIFTEINGSTPLEYLTAIRLEKAKNSLQNPKKPILEVAIECGFDNTAYFSNTFKRRLGLSPTQFRNSL
jgi:AraC-like DNA-binding protein